jgi:hypothetical protein
MGKDMKRQRRLSIWLASLLGFLVIGIILATSGYLLDGGGESDRLTKEDAVTLIKNHTMFKDEMPVLVNTGVIHAPLADIERYQPKYLTLKSMGLVELSSTKIEPRDKGSSRSTEGTRVSLTEKGLTESKSWKQLRQDAWEVPVAKRVLVEVLEIHETDRQIIGIDFSWLWEVNETGKALDLTFAPERARATFERKDNQWVISRIRALSQ